jgi:glycosyltransferase involved in cell wall biosynthesis
VVRDDDDLSASFLASREGSFRVVPVSVAAGRPGFVAGLNAGLDASTGEVVCFTDDDAEPRPDWVSKIVAGFEADPDVGALGGRDWVFHDGVPEDGSEPTVGVVSGWGRTIGNHHLGVGAPRDVDVLKGVNLGLRGDLARSIGFDTRLLGVATEHHSELHLCLAVKRRGFRVVYDPGLGVDHRPAPRAAEGRSYGPRQVHDSSHNESLALLDHLPPGRAAVHLGYATLVGARGAPGLAQSVRLGLTTGDPRLDLLRANLAGRRRALATRRRSAVLAIADSGHGAVRARQLLAGRPGVRILAPRGVRDALTALGAVATTRARNLYLVDVGKITATAALIGRLRRRHVVLDTGDAVFALARSLGDRSFLGLLAVGAGEKAALRCADEIVVRGRRHADLVPGTATHIPDLAPPGAGPADAGSLRRELNLDESFVVGLVGSLILSRRLGVSYGWDLVEALALTAPEVQALVVGDGSGRAHLEGRARDLGVAARCRFVGQVESDRVSTFVAAMDATISTQTDDVVGRVRTTGKLPLYLACGRPVLASAVGEAERLLGPLGWTLPFRGRLDRDYPARLAERIESWRADPAGAEDRRRIAREIAAAEFDPATMRARLEKLLP